MPVSMSAILIPSPCSPLTPSHTWGAPISGIPWMFDGCISSSGQTATTPGSEASCAALLAEMLTLKPL